MEYRRLGRTELQVSAVGTGTGQLRLVPEKQAIDTLLKSFALGVNIVHTAPDYGNAEEIVGRVSGSHGTEAGNSRVHGRRQSANVIAQRDHIFVRKIDYDSNGTGLARVRRVRRERSVEIA